MWSCMSVIQVFVSLFIIIWLILIYFGMGSIQLYRLQKCPHFVVFFSINCIIKFLLKEIIIFLLCYCFMLFGKCMKILFSFLSKWFCHYKRCGHIVFSNFRTLNFAHSLSHLLLIRIRYSNNLVSCWNLALTYLMTILWHLILQFWLRLR